MSAAKSPKALSLIGVVALVAALAIAGCGGAGGKVVSGQTPPSNPPSPAVEPQGGAGTEAATGEEGEEAGGEEATSEGASEGEEATSEGESGGAEAEGSGESEEAESGGEEGGEAAGGATASAEGMTVFTTNCGSCHTLAAAGTSGNVGPNLDELMPSESTVEYQVINGGGPMPAFGKEEILSAAEVKAVAAYVSSEAGK